MGKVMSIIKSMDLRVGNTVQPDGFSRGRIVTVEHSTLARFNDRQKIKDWACFTVETDKKPPDHKYLLVDLGKDGIILWKPSKLKTPPEGAKVWMDYCGLEEMENISGSKPESFIYSMMSFVLDPQAKRPTKFYSMERLRNGKAYHYEGFRVG